MNRKAKPVCAYISDSFALGLEIFYFLEVERGMKQRRVNIKPQKMKKRGQVGNLEHTLRGKLCT